MRISRFLVLAAMFAILAAMAAVAASNVLNAKIDGGLYAPGADITVSGTLYSGTSLSSDTLVLFTVDENSGNATTDANGEFSGTIAAPTSQGDYTLTVSAGDAEAGIPITVSLIDNVLIEFVDSFYIISMVSDDGITTDVSGAGPEGDDTGQTGYAYVLVANSNGDYDSVFADTDTAVNEDDSAYKYLGEESSIKINGDSYVVSYIDPAGSMILLVKRSSTIYSEAGNQQVLALATNSTENPLANVNLTYAVYQEGGIEALSEGSFGTTDSSGAINASIPISGTTSTYALVLNNKFVMSYKVETFSLIGFVVDMDGNKVSKVAPGSTVTLKVSAINKSDNSVINSATGSAVVNYLGSSDSVELSADEEGVMSANFTVPDQAGEYFVMFTVGVDDNSNTISTIFKAVSLDFSLMAFANGDKGKSDGFAPGQQGIVLLSGKDGNGDFLNLTIICNETNITVLGIFNKKDANVMTNMTTTIMRLQDFLAEIEGIGQQEMDKIYEEVGSESCIIQVVAPARTGAYTFKAAVSVNGDTYTLMTPILVQDIFVDAWPSSEDGRRFVHATSIGGTVNLAIKAYDLVTGDSIDKAEILSASIIEVSSEQAGTVTEEMVNAVFTNTQENALLSFTANDSIAGFHDVKFRIRANVTRNSQETTIEADGHGWFNEKLYSIWVYPDMAREMKGVFGGNSTVSLTVEVRDAGGNSGEEGKTASLDSIWYGETGETVSMADVNSGQSASCETNSNGTCTLSFSAPSSNWKSGFYNIRVKVTSTEIADDGSETSMSDYGYGWFQVRNFYLYSYVPQFEVSKDDANISFQMNAYDFNGAPLNATARLTKILYMGTWSSMSRPIVLIEDSNGLVTGEITDGSGSLALPIEGEARSGNYMAVIEATNSLGVTETTMAWFMIRTFTLYIQQDWNHMTYGTSEIVNLTLMGYESISSWEGGQPTGAPKNMSEAWVQSIEREGMWGMPFKKRSSLIANNGMNSSCTGNTCNLWFNLSGFSQGSYNLVIYAKDLDQNQVEGWYYMRVEVLGIRLPAYQTLDASTTYTISNVTSFNISDDCGGVTDAPAEPANVSSCKYGKKRMVHVMDYMNAPDNRGNMQYNTTYFLIDLTNESSPKLYIINNTLCPEGDAEVTPPSSCLFNQSGITYKVAGDTFFDSQNNQWVIKTIDAVTRTVTAEVKGAIIGYQDPGCNGGGCLYNKYLIRVNNGWSKSGTFYQAPSLHDEQWNELDLDGDGNMNWDEEYPAILADSSAEGAYDLLVVSNTSNFAADGRLSSSADGISFGGNPSYVTAIKYKKGTSSQDGSSAGADSYQIKATGNKAPDWNDNDLGIFKPGTIIKVPIMITQPGNLTQKIANAIVNITGLIKFGMSGQQEVPLVVPVQPVNTSAAGLAVVTVNTSGVVNGDYFLRISVTYAGQTVTQSNMWDNPRAQLRNFELRGEMGNRGVIPNLRKIAPSEGNMRVVEGDMTFHSEGMDFYFMWTDAEMRRGTWEFWNIYYNVTNNQLILDPTPNDFMLTPQDAAVARRYFIPPAGAIINYTTPKRGVPLLANFTVNEGQNNFRITFPVLHDLSNVNYAGGQFRVVRAFNDSSFVYYLYTSNIVPHEPWDDNPNYVTVTDFNGDIVGEYAVGQPIAEFGNFAVAKATNWDRDIVLVNETLGGNTIKFPREWADSTNEFYIGTFSEQSINMRFVPEQGQNSGQFRNLTNSTHYLVCYDDTWDGVQAVNSMKMTSSVNNSLVDFSSWGQNMYQARVGEQYGWPFILNEIDTAGLQAKIFKPIWNLWVEENTTVWILAREFDGQPVQGNATILSVKQMMWDKNGEQQNDIIMDGFSTLDSGGNAYVPFNAWNQSMGDYTVRIKVTSSQTGKSEIQENKIFIMDPNMMGPGSGGGGHGDGEGECMDPPCGML